MSNKAKQKAADVKAIIKAAKNRSPEYAALRKAYAEKYNCQVIHGKKYLPAEPVAKKRKPAAKKRKKAARKPGHSPVRAVFVSGGGCSPR